MKTPLAFAYITDLHLPPWPREAWPDRYAHAIAWWDQECAHPHDGLSLLLDQIAVAGVDFVFFGGDSLDVYDTTTANRLAELCQQRKLDCYFSFGNHDFESLEIRYVTHDDVPEVRRENTGKLLEHWSMPHRYYHFDRAGVRFIVLDTPYQVVEGGWAGSVDQQQVQWLVHQLEFDGPILLFYHIPFRTDENQDRLLLVWNGVRAWMAEDAQSQKVLTAINACPNLLGTFAGHSHVRSEDKIGDKWQFVTAAGHYNAWRHVRIGNQAAPKSLCAAGWPTVEEEA
ncbi:MAG: hypothetical protein CMJ81_18480 [Planctomycetaceae bacterium]|nr:hypothetical protein [Planctomycetaceae bacterium]